MSFKNDVQLSGFCAAVLGQRLAGNLWSPQGPTREAVRLYQEDGGYLSSGERVLLLAAFSFWNTFHNDKLRFVELMKLDGDNLVRVADALRAMGTGLLDDYISFYNDDKEPCPCCGRRVGGGL